MPNKRTLEPFPCGYTPSQAEVEKYCRLWDSLPNYTAHEEALSGLFRGEGSPYRHNVELSAVIIKVSALNDFYSTNIYRVYDVARKIVSIPDFDARLDRGDVSLVEDFATVEFDTPGGVRKSITYYSFATKYCSHHRPALFPIYDSYVAAVLKALRRQKVLVFANNDLRQYPEYKRQLDILRKRFALTCDYKILDNASSG